jgi:outer membrane protein assembly factor BamB
LFHRRRFAVLSGLAACLLATLIVQAAEKPADEKTIATTNTSQNIDPGDWPQWRGPYRDGMSRETGLLDSWPEGGPPLAWKLTGLGNGVASVVTAKGRLYTLGNKDKASQVQCFDLATRQPIWSCKVTQGFDQGERASLVVDNGQVFGCTGNSTFFGIDANGKLIWKMNARADMHGDMQHMYGYSETPLVDGDQVVFTPGAKDAMMVAVKRNTGEFIWKMPAPMVGPNGGADLASYSSIIVTNGGGLRHYVQLIARGLVGVDPKTGKYLWGYNRIAVSHSNIPTPMASGDYIVCSNGYGGGTCSLKLSPDGNGGVKAEEVFYLKPDICANQCGQSCLIGDFLYTSHGQYAGTPMCVNFKTGKIAWKADKEPGAGVAGMTFADGKLIFRAENNVTSLVAADPTGYRLISTFIPASDKPGLSHPVVSHGLLFIRKDDMLLAYDIRKK